MKNKKALLVFFIVVIATVVILWFVDYKKSNVVEEKVKPKIRAVVTEKALEDRFVISYDTSGKVASTTYRVGADVIRGRISNVFVKEGDYVKEGAPIVSLDVTSAIAQLRLQITGIEQSLNELDLSIRQLEKKREDLLKMYDKGLTAKNNIDELFDNIKTLELKKQGLINNKAAINSQINEIAGAGYIYTKKSGIVEKVKVKVNQYPTMDDYIEIKMDKKPDVRVYLTEEVVSNISVGEPVDVSIKDGIYKSTIREIHSLQPGDILYPVDVEMDTTQKFLSGTTALVKIPIYKKDAAVLINRKAIIHFNDEVFLYKLEGDKVVKTLVNAGETVGSRTEILSGLSVGDEVVVEGQFSIVDGEKVEVLAK